MYKPIAVTICALMLQGCMYQSVNTTDLLKANYFCRDKLGVESITADFIGQEKVWCINGNWTWLDGMKLP